MVHRHRPEQHGPLEQEASKKTTPESLVREVRAQNEVGTGKTNTAEAFVADPNKCEAALAAIYTKLCSLPKQHRQQFLAAYDARDPVIQYLNSKDAAASKLKNPSDLA